MAFLLIFLVILSVLVIGHELGHFVAARICKVKVEEFGYGFPPRAIGWVRVNRRWKRVGSGDPGGYQNTIWSLNWLPIGGFVRLKGEDAIVAQEKDAFGSKGVWARLFILAAGVGANWLIAAAIFIIGFSVGIPAQTSELPRGAVVQDARVEIMDVAKGSGAHRAGLKAGDRILRVSGVSVDRAESVQKMFAQAAFASESIELEILRGSQKRITRVSPFYLPEAQRVVFGVGLDDIGTVRLPFFAALRQGFVTSALYTKWILQNFWEFLRDLFGPRKAMDALTGPIGMAVVTGEIARLGVWPLAKFASLISLNLAIINFLPIPALDGGRILFVLVESLRRKRINPNIESLAHHLGFLFLMIVVIAVSFKDLFRYGGVIWQGVRGLVGLT